MLDERDGLRTVAASALMSSPLTAGTILALGMAVANRFPTSACSLHSNACNSSF